MKCAGFSLIECMIYCILLAILFMTWFHGMVVSHTMFAKESTHMSQLSNIYAAQDVLIRDIRQAPAAANQWKRCTNSVIIWHGYKTDIGWTVRDNKLVRIEGRYDTKKQKWHSKKQSVALFDVRHIAFTKHGTQDYIQCIECQLVLQNNKTINTYIALRNGVING